MVKVLVNGALGRMGQAVVKAVINAETTELVAAVDLTGGMDVGEFIGLPAAGVIVETDLERTINEKKPDVMVDFTQPDAVFSNTLTALSCRVATVIGTTGLSSTQKNELKRFSEQTGTPVFIAPNFAIGAVLMMQMAKQAAKYLPDVEIIELHHDKKLDAPSGTALETARLISEVRTPHKQGHPDEKEKLAGARGGDVDGIRIHSVRLPGYVAHQEVIFGGLGQTLTIRHDSLDRESFMPGVIIACEKIGGLKGLVVGLDKLL